MKESKIQELIIKYLLSNGEIQILLPDGMQLDIGITQEGRNGELHKTDDYCWLIAQREGDTVAIDSYHAGMKFLDNAEKLICQNNGIDEEGKKSQYVEII